MRKELKRYVREHPNLTFKDLREEALRWAEEDEVYPARKGVTSNLVDVTGDPSCDRTDVVGATGGAKTIELLQDQMKALIQLQENQQEQIKQQGQMITTLAEGINKRMEGMSKRMDNAWHSPNRKRDVALGQNKKENLRCYACNNYGHFRRECPSLKDKRTDKSAPQSVDTGSMSMDSRRATLNAELMDKTVGQRPTTKAKFAGVEVNCLVDTGSMVTTISETFFKDWIRAAGRDIVDPVEWLTVRAANGI